MYKRLKKVNSKDILKNFFKVDSPHRTLKIFRRKGPGNYNIFY